MFESHADQREIEKFRLHLNEIDTITSVLLKLSSRWSKIENDLHKCSDEKKVMRKRFVFVFVLNSSRF